MRYFIEGQVNYISPPEAYNKQGEKKVVIAITQGNKEHPNRIEHIPFDFLGENGIAKINEVMVGVGDWVRIGFELRGRKYVPQDKSKPLFYLNLEAITIEVV